MKKHILTLGFLCISAAAPAMASVASAEKVEAHYDFLWKGLKVSTAEAAASLTPETYEFSMNFRMRGLAKIFVSGRSQVMSSGRIEGAGQVVPRRYRSTGRWDGEDYNRTIAFGPDGTLENLSQEWPEKWLEKYPREDVPEDMRRGPDPASVAVALMTARLSQVTAEEGVSLQVYDGDMVFDYLLTCSPDPVELEPSRHSDFSGEARACGIEGRLVAGKRIYTEKELRKMEKKRAKEEKRRKKRGGKEDDSDEEAPVFYLAEMGEAGYMLPVRATMSTDMGKVTMYLSHFAVSPAAAGVPQGAESASR